MHILSFRCAPVITLSILLGLGAVGCGSKKGDAARSNSDSAKTGSLTVDGQTQTCNVTTQLFPATKEFSVLCQNDNFGFVQVTFKDEVSARRAQKLTVIEGVGSSHPDGATIVVGFSPLSGGPTGPGVVSRDGAAGTAAGTGKAVTLTGVVLTEFAGTVTHTVTATINF